MRYLEYIYLAGAIAIAAYLGTSYQDLPTLTFIGLCIAAGLMAFMYSFRRSQRLLFEKLEREQPDDEEEAEAEEEAATQDHSQDSNTKEEQDGN
jgi:uncharacterized membrane protein